MKGLLMKDTHVIREAQQIKVLADKITKAIKIIKSKKLEPSFEPSMKTLSRIMKTITEKGAEGKTQLSLDTKLNYARLAKHIVWLEKKGLAKSTIEDNKINVALTAKGREFASMISE
ncbi:MAG: winged helix-turn-helix domain-containing protein [Thermoproteota archaeon]